MEQGRKAAAVAAALAASRRKGAAINIPADGVARLRALFQDAQPAELAGDDVAAAGAGLPQRLGALFDNLAGLGFAAAQIQDALRAVAPRVSRAATLDWLCLNLKSEDLPRAFAAGAQGEAAAAPVRVVAAGDASRAAAAAEVRDSSAATIASADDPWQQAPASAASPAGAAAARNGGGGGGGGNGDAAEPPVAQPDQKRWIQQYMEEWSDSDGGASQSEEDGSVEDWELFADPREIERRKAERKRAALPVETRRKLVADEFAAAKAEAAKAKADGDKGRQRAAGKMIRSLKQEMAQLGISEESLHQHPAAAARQQEAEAAPASTIVDAAANCSNGAAMSMASAAAALAAEPPDEEDDFFSGLAAADDFEAADGVAAPPEQAAASTQQAAVSHAGKGDPADGADTAALDVYADAAYWQDDGPAAQPTAAPRPQDVQAAGQAIGSSAPAAEDEDELTGGLFDEDGGGSAWEAAAPRLTPKPAPKPAQPKKGRKGGKAAAAPPPEPPKQPKATLQQHCAATGLPPPQFSKLPPGGGRQEALESLQKAAAQASAAAAAAAKALAKAEAAGAATAADAADAQALRLRADAAAAEAAAAAEIAPGLMRYTVTVAAASSGKGGHGRGRKAPAASRCFQLPEALDGWATINDAQSAAATLALQKLLCPEEGLALSGRLPPGFQRLWVQLASAGPAPADADKQSERDAFIAQLAADIQAGRRAAKTGVRGIEQTNAMPGIASGRDQQAAMRRPSNAAADAAESRRLADELASFRASPAGQKWAAQRAALPVAEIRTPLLEALQGGADVAVVSGDTGCGKTTQVPQYLLEAAAETGSGAACSVVCTQPRRIAAISVAERVANERGEPPPGTPGSRVGYHVRLDAAASRDTRLLFCTTGILLRRLAGDPGLASVSHVVVDEVHERTLQGDFLMALLRDLVPRRRAAGNPLKFILMSATLDAGLFAQYFGKVAGSGGVPTLAAGGRTFPVQQLYLEDVYEATGYRLAPDSEAALHEGGGRRRRGGGVVSQRGQRLVQAGWGDDEADAGPLNRRYDAVAYANYSATTRANLARLAEAAIDYELVEAVVAHIDDSQPEGAILVFLPGMAEIRKAHDLLAAGKRFRSPKAAAWLLPLHSSVSSDQQRRVFQVPPPGIRKVVLATNIAETSLTISDVVYVIDSGKLKERRHNAARGMSLLVEDFVSQAAARQRAGRAGRVRPGMCFALYTRDRYDNLRPYQAPEMVRVPLEELVLQIHLLGLGPAAHFLATVLQPPPASAVDGALASLRAVGALTEDERLTPLGRHLAALPVDAKIGKLLVLSAALGCLGPGLSVAAAASHKSPFQAPFDQQDAANRARQTLAAPGAKNLAAGQQSDHLLDAAAIAEWLALRRRKGREGRQAASAFARSKFLNESTLEMLADMRAQFARMLADAGLVPAEAAATAAGGGGGGADGWDASTASWNRHADRPAVVKAALAGALYPNVAVMDESSTTGRPGWNDGVAEVALHPASVLHPLEAPRFLRPFVVYLEKVKTSRTFLRDASVASPLALALFGAGNLDVVHESGYITLGGWLRFRAPAQVAVLVRRLRAGLEATLEQLVGGGSGSGNTSSGSRSNASDVVIVSGGAGDLVDVAARLLEAEEAAVQRDRA